MFSPYICNKYVNHCLILVYSHPRVPFIAITVARSLCNFIVFAV